MKIAVLDPSIRNHRGDPSINLGDVIIYDAVDRFLLSHFRHAQITRVSTHQFLEEHHYRAIEKSDLIFIGGTNLLSSDIETYNQWKLSDHFQQSPRIKNAILFGVGWWQYQHPPTKNTSAFYNAVLSKTWIHSVRDFYTLSKLADMGITNVVNTGCPTTWGLHGIESNRKTPGCHNCVFTLTDYHPHVPHDTRMIETILANYSGNIYFFPQGSEDIRYIKSLDIYATRHERITVLDHHPQALDQCIAGRHINYIGTRLHAGTHCLQSNIESLILAVDNRATEIGKDTALPIVQRGDFSRLEDWIAGKKLFGSIHLPLEDIERWRGQFLYDGI